MRVPETTRAWVSEQARGEVHQPCESTSTRWEERAGDQVHLHAGKNKQVNDQVHLHAERNDQVNVPEFRGQRRGRQSIHTSAMDWSGPE